MSHVQARALVNSGELPAIQVGGRGQWRVEVSELEAYIQRQYAQARAKTGRAGPSAEPPEPEEADARTGQGSGQDSAELS